MATRTACRAPSLGLATICDYVSQLLDPTKRIQSSIFTASGQALVWPAGSIVASGSSMSPPPYRVTTFFRRCLLGAFLSKILTKIKVLDGTLRYCVARSQRPTTTTSILRPIRSQFYVQFDLNFTSNSTSIIRPIRPQLYHRTV